MTQQVPMRSLAVACPYCGANAGEKCVTKHTRIEIDNVHPSRSEAYVVTPKERA